MYLLRQNITKQYSAMQNTTFVTTFWLTYIDGWLSFMDDLEEI